MSLHLVQRGAAHNLPLSDKILIEQAKLFMEELGISSVGFKSSHGWLQNLKKRQDLKAHKICWESAIVNKINLIGAREELKKICSEFQPFDRYNFDDTAIFFRLHSITLSDKSVHEQKIYKSRLSVGLCKNADGSDKVKPVVIS